MRIARLQRAMLTAQSMTDSDSLKVVDFKDDTRQLDKSQSEIVFFHMLCKT